MHARPKDWFDIELCVQLFQPFLAGHVLTKLVDERPVARHQRSEPLEVVVNTVEVQQGLRHVVGVAHGAAHMPGHAAAPVGDARERLVEVLRKRGVQPRKELVVARA